MVHRWCAVNAADTEDPPSGRFVFAVGPSASKAKVAAEGVKWGPYDECWSEVARRINMLIAEGAPHVWVRSYREGETHYCDSVHVIGEPSLAGDDDDTALVGQAGLFTAHSRVVDRLSRGVEQLVARNQELADALGESRVQTGLYHLAALTADQAGGSAAMREAIAAFAPIAGTAVPVLLEEVIRSWREARSAENREDPTVPPPHGPPEDPTEAIGWYLDELEELSDRLNSHVAGHQHLWTRAHVERVQQWLHLRFGAPLPRAEPPAEEPPPAAEEPPRRPRGRRKP